MFEKSNSSRKQEKYFTDKNKNVKSFDESMNLIFRKKAQDLSTNNTILNLKIQRSEKSLETRSQHW